MLQVKTQNLNRRKGVVYKQRFQKKKTKVNLSSGLSSVEEWSMPLSSKVTKKRKKEANKKNALHPPGSWTGRSLGLAVCD
jgi:hypothetical protein